LERPPINLRCTYDSVDVDVLSVGGDRNRLNEKLVAALGVERRVLLHGLE